MFSFTTYYGIDVSKDTLDIYQLDVVSSSATGYDKNNSKPLLKQINNQSSSIEKWIKSLSAITDFCVLEATGTYSSKLIHLLDQHQIKFSVVSPYKSKSFMAALGVTNKTDEKAAYCLAMMGKMLELKPYKLPSVMRQKRKQLQTAHNALMKQRQMLSNQLHALEQLHFVEASSKSAYEQVLQTVDQQIEQLEEQLNSLEDDEDYETKKNLACSVVGIGDTTAHAMLIAANGFDQFDTIEELAKYFGLTPNSHYSGSSVRKKGHISKIGAPYVRKLLYMCTRSAIRYNLACKELYQRLRKKGKPHKVAAVAVMHKLVKQVFACVKTNTTFDNNYYLKFKIN